jgi:hemerythrin
MIVWSEEYRVGHPVIDADHQALIKIIRAFCE